MNIPKLATLKRGRRLPLALLGAITAGSVSLSGQVAGSGVPADDQRELERVTVVGSRIKRIDFETPNPVLRISREELDSTGFSTLADAMRSLPQNSGFSPSPIDSGTAFAPGLNAVNIRGLGANNVLVLLNGRRMSPFGASASPGFVTVFDLNAIPTAAIESIEVLKDGGSAIYGSDAVTGVVNINLRKDFQGLSTEFGIGNTFDTDSFERRFAAVVGTTSGNTSIIGSFDYRRRNAIFARDMERTSDPDLARYTDADGIPGYNWRSTARFPGNANIPGLGWVHFPTPSAMPRAEDAVPGFGDYNYLLHSDIFPKETHYGAYMRFDHAFSTALRTFGEISFRRAETRSESAPTPVFNRNEQGFRPDGSASPFGIVVPATNPFNPFGIELNNWRTRLIEAGNRINEVTSDTPRVVFGVGGDVGFSWGWEAAMTYSKSTSTNNNAGAHQDRLVQNALNGVTNSEGATFWLNPFGPSDPFVLNYITITNPVTSAFEVITFDVGTAGDLFELGAGALGLAVGAEYREERLQDIRTALNVTGQIVGGSEGSSVFGRRDVQAVYAELRVPVVTTLEVQVAARHERYSDFGSTTKPKLAASFRPIPQLMLRASYGESFLAPNLPFLYAAQSTSFTPNNVIDPSRPQDPPKQIKTLSGGNPDLQPEETDVQYIGAVWEFRDGALEGLSFGADYFKFDTTNTIERLTVTQILNRELAGDPVAQRLVIRGPDGVLDAVRANWQNIGTRTWRGFDFNTQYGFNTGMGRFSLGAATTYIREISFNNVDNAGEQYYPKWRGNLTARWTSGVWGAAVFVDYIHSRSGDPDALFGGARYANARYPSYTRVNPQISYAGFFDTKITVGVRNVFDKAPPVDFGEGTGYTRGLHNPEPAFWYMRVAKDF
jgi:iron complex outermembrane recepter protein